jgi:POT family proton-dependent oligopeptide transporter
MSNSRGFFGHPNGLATLFFTEMWERFSYYGMRAILILFMTTEAAQEGLGLETETAGAVYGLYTAAVYLLTLPGGWLADNIFGQRRTIWYGGICIMIGHLILAIPGSPGIFFTGLAFVAIGTGLLKPNISTIVGDLYPEGGARRDAGFSVFYMGINLGSFLGQIIVPLLAEKVDWHLGFGMAAVGMFFGLLQYRLTQGTLGDIGITPKAKESDDLLEEVLPGRGNSRALAIGLTAALIALIVILQFTGVIDLTTAPGIAQSVGIIIVAITLFYFAYIFIAGGLNAAEKKRVGIIFLLFIGAAIFWSGFEQAGSSLNLFAFDHTDRYLFGWEVPAGWLQSVNPAMIIIFAPIIGALWVKLSARNLNPSTPLKFGLGLILLGIGFLMVVFAAQIATTGEKAGMFWLVLTYFFHSIGELTLSPVGLSATTKLSPKRFVGQMMGIWFVATALGNLIAGLFAGNFDEENVQQMPDLFMSVVMISVGAGIVFIILSPFMKKWTGGVE